ncbi:MAG: glycosyltransferase family 39 protein [Candidatus Andersenbacteria bacterium]|nr:glycosyltransferase family 39 protein [Candidatus Andersenbacteria bacterium]MBI3250255.1 glycosyltransferase family 39 protein [Candidatus Andersenbacteria bacterium]
MSHEKLVLRVVVLAVFLPRLLFPDAFTQLDEQRWVFRANDAMDAFVTGDFSNTGSLGYPAVTHMATIAPVIVMYRTIAGLEGHTDSWPLEHQHYVIVWARLVIGLVTGFISLLLYYLLRKSPLFDGNSWMIGALTIAIANEPWLLGMSRIMMMDAYISFFIILSLVAGLVSRWRSNHQFLILSGVAFGLAFITKSTASFFGPFLLIPFIAGSLRESSKRIAWWCGIGALTIFVFWPAMWVHPIERIGELLFWDSTHALELREPLYWPGWHPPFAFLVLAVPSFIGLIAYIGLRMHDFYRRHHVSGMLLGDLAFGMALAFQLIMAYVVADRSRWILPAIALFAIPGAIGLLRLLRLWLAPKTAALVLIVASVITVVYWHPYPTLAVNPLFYTESATWQLGMGEGSRQVAEYLAQLPPNSSVATKIPSLIDRYLTYSHVEVTRFPQSNDFSELPDNTTHLVLPMSRNRILFEENIGDVYEWMDEHTPEFVVNLRGIPLYGIYGYER